jgi:hypothetical protein
MKLTIYATEYEDGTVVIDRIISLTKGQLPAAYCDVEPNVYLSGNSWGQLVLASKKNQDGEPIAGKNNLLVAGSAYTKAYFNEQVEYCKKAVKRLKRINNGIRNKIMIEL